MMILVVNDVEVEVRAGMPADIPLLLSFIQAMAAYEKLTVSATEETLRAALFGEAPAAYAILAYVDGKPLGYLIYCFTFASMTGKRTLWLDDLYIEPPFRGNGIGKALMSYLAVIAQQNQCARFEWMVLDWNEPAIGFYRRLGANILSDWSICRLDATQLSLMANRLQMDTSKSRAILLAQNERGNREGNFHAP